MDSFAGKLAVVTGGGSGIGRELVRQLAAAGCSVATCDLNPDTVAETVTQGEPGAAVEVTVTGHVCDVSDEAQVLRFRDEMLDAHGTDGKRADHVDLVFSNAGVGGAGSFIKDSREEWERVFAIDWWGVYYCARAFLPLLIKSAEGVLVNTSSANGFFATLGPGAPHTAYSTAKFAVKGFSEALIEDLRTNAPHVRVAVVMPGHVGTNIVGNSLRAFGLDPEHMTDEELEAFRPRLAERGLPDGMPIAELRQILIKVSAGFRDKAPVTAAEAATVILDGVRSGAWRILIGKDAERIDAFVRADPEATYDYAEMRKSFQDLFEQDLFDQVLFEAADQLGRQRAGQYLAVRAESLAVLVLARGREDDVDPAPVIGAAASLHQAVPFQPVGEPGHRALAEVHRVGQALCPVGAVGLAGQVVEHLEVAHPESVPFAELALEGVPRRDLGGDERTPGRLHRFVAVPGLGRAPCRGGRVRCHARILACLHIHCKYINCSCNKCTYMHTVGAMAETTTTETTGTTETTWTPQLWGILLVLSGALLLDGLDVSMVGVALPAIRTALHMSTSSLQWIVSGYTLGYGGLLLLGGRAADLLGRRRVFIAAVAVFAVVSLLGGIVSSPGLLVAARIIKGMAAAFTAPASMSLLTTTFPEGPLRNRAFSVYSVFGASGFSLGLVLSGLLTQASWRLTLLVSAPAAALVLLGAVTLIPRGEGGTARAGRRFDLPGAAVITATMLLFVFTIVNAQQAGWGSARTIGSFAGVVVLAAAFAVIETRSPDPLVPFGIFRSAPLRRAQVGAITLFGSYVSFQFLMTQYLQSLSHWSAIGTALAFLPAGVIVAVLSLRTAGLLSRFGTEALVATAFVALVAAYGLFLRAGVTPDYPAVMLPTVILVGVAFGFGFSALTVSATSGVRNEQQGLAASLFQTSFQVGGAVVLALVTAVVEAGGANTLTSPAAVLSAYRPALYLITGVAVLGLAAALPGLRRGSALPAVEVPAQELAALEVDPVSGSAEQVPGHPGQVSAHRLDRGVGVPRS